MQIFGEIPFVKPQNNTLTTEKRLKMTNERKKTYLVLVKFLLLVRMLAVILFHFPNCLVLSETTAFGCVCCYYFGLIQNKAQSAYTGSLFV